MYRMCNPNQPEAQSISLAHSKIKMIRVQLIDQCRLVLLQYKLMFKIIKAFIPGRRIKKGFNSIDVIKIFFVLPKCDEDILDDVFNLRLVSDVFIAECTKRTEILIKNLVKGFFIS